MNAIVTVGEFVNARKWPPPPLEFLGQMPYNNEVMNRTFSISMHLCLWVTRKGYLQGVLSDLER
jgi:hypothetical protein